MGIDRACLNVDHQQRNEKLFFLFYFLNNNNNNNDRNFVFKWCPSLQRMCQECKSKILLLIKMNTKHHTHTKLMYNDHQNIYHILRCNVMTCLCWWCILYFIYVFKQNDIYNVKCVHYQHFCLCFIIIYCVCEKCAKYCRAFGYFDVIMWISKLIFKANNWLLMGF